MLSLKFIRQNPQKIEEACKKRQVIIDINKILKLDKEKRKYQKTIEDLKAEQRKLSFSTPLPLKKLTGIKNEIKKLESLAKERNKEINDLLLEIPNLPLNGVPEGRDESNNIVLREEGEKRKFDFLPKDYLEINKNLDWIDIKRAAKVSGSRFGFLKKEAALLEFSLINFTFKELIKEGFIPLIPPVLIKKEAMRKMGYIDTEEDLAERYFLEKDNLFLVGTSEQSIGPMHQDEIFEEKDLPKRYLAFSACFREEAGSYGKDTKGILRVHQFDKIEMFSFTKPEDSEKEHKFFLFIEEKLMKILKIPYRVVQVCTGDLARPAAATFDLEAWFPGQGRYRETHSTSNCTDFQARRLNIRYLNSETKKLEFVHTINGTAFAIGRILIAIMENYQQKNGKVKIPEISEELFGF